MGATFNCVCQKHKGEAYDMALSYRALLDSSINKPAKINRTKTNIPTRYTRTTAITPTTATTITIENKAVAKNYTDQ